MIACDSAISPPPPIPWMARKAISWPMFCDRPARTDPTRKMPMAAWKIRLRPYRSLILPNSGVAAVDVSR